MGLNTKVNTFWYKIHTELEAVFGSKMTFNWDELERKPDTPYVKEWYDIFYEIFVMESITFSIRLRGTTFEEIWKTWKKYISPKCPSFV